MTLRGSRLRCDALAIAGAAVCFPFPDGYFYFSSYFPSALFFFVLGCPWDKSLKYVRAVLFFSSLWLGFVPFSSRRRLECLRVRGAARGEVSGEAWEWCAQCDTARCEKRDGRPRFRFFSWGAEKNERGRKRGVKPKADPAGEKHFWASRTSACPFTA